MIPPTKEQARTLSVIRSLTHNDVPPSYRELQSALGLQSLSNVHGVLSRLKDRGLVDFEFGRARSLRIIDQSQSLDLAKLSKEQLTTLRTRIETELVGRWKL